MGHCTIREPRRGGKPAFTLAASRYTQRDSVPFVHCVSCRLLSSGSLRKLLVGWNQVCRLAERLERSQLEVLDLQHNNLTELPHNLFIKAQRCTQQRTTVFSFCPYLFFPCFISYLFVCCSHLSFSALPFPSCNLFLYQVICSSTKFAFSVGNFIAV